MADPAPRTDVDPRLTAVTAYLLGFVTGALILWRYGDDDYVAFHAWQSILFSVFLGAVIVGASTVPIAGLAMAVAGMALGTVTWVVLAVQAYRGRWTMLPLLGDIALERSRLRGEGR